MPLMVNKGLRHGSSFDTILRCLLGRPGNLTDTLILLNLKDVVTKKNYDKVSRESWLKRSSTRSSKDISLRNTLIKTMEPSLDWKKFFGIKGRDMKKIYFAENPPFPIVDGLDSQWLPIPWCRFDCDRTQLQQDCAKTAGFYNHENVPMNVRVPLIQDTASAGES